MQISQCKAVTDLNILHAYHITQSPPHHGSRIKFHHFLQKLQKSLSGAKALAYFAAHPYAYRARIYGRRP